MLPSLGWKILPPPPPPALPFLVNSNVSSNVLPIPKETCTLGLMPNALFPIKAVLFDLKNGCTSLHSLNSVIWYICTDPASGKHRVFWEDPQDAQGESQGGGRIKFSGIPYMLVNSKLHDCQHGVDRNKAVKRKLAAKEEVNKHFLKLHLINW